jgi:hypothetical protein
LNGEEELTWNRINKKVIAYTNRWYSNCFLNEGIDFENTMNRMEDNYTIIFNHGDGSVFVQRMNDLNERRIAVYNRKQAEDLEEFGVDILSSESGDGYKNRVFNVN